MNLDATDAPTIADWWVGFREETTAIRSLLVRPARTPAQT